MKKKELEFHLQPIRKMVLAKVLFHFLNSGLFDIISKDDITIEDLGKNKSFNSKVVFGLIKYLKNEEVIYIDAKGYIKISEAWRNIEEYKPWYDLLVGGYSNTFDQIGDLLKFNKDYASRNSQFVGKGSCGISQFDALPMTIELMDASNRDFDLIIDIGCGDGSFLIDICSQKEQLQGIGLDIDMESIKYGNKLAAKFNIAHRVSFKKHEIGKLPKVSKEKNICIIAAFLLQEVLEQDGETKLINLINSIFNHYSAASLVVIEVDNKFENHEMFNDNLAKAYYNPYYLLHVLTEQKLESDNYWKNLFKKQGLTLKKVVHPNPEYDNLKLKIGYLIEKI